MIPKVVALAACAAACGSVADDPPTGSVDAAIISSPPTTYQGRLDETPPVIFGGTFGGTTYCTYTITLKELQIELALLSSGQVSSGRVEALNVEGTPACPHGLIPPNIATYVFDSAKPSAGGMSLTFQGAASNVPRVSLVVELSSIGEAYQAQLGFKRTDQPMPFDWSVIATVSLSLAPAE